MKSSFRHIFYFNNSIRHARLIDKSLLWKENALKKLTTFIRNNAGICNTGARVSRSRGTRARKRARIVTHTNTLFNVPGIILRVEYDPNRSAFISMVVYANGICAYVSHSVGLFVSDRIQAYAYRASIDSYSVNVPLRTGDSCLLYSAPNGTVVHDVEYAPSSGSGIARAAGTYGIVLKKFYSIRRSLIRLPSTQTRSISFFSMLVKGVVSNELHYRTRLGKAGRNRLLGYKPIVRGVAKNPVDHPHGGGEGKKSKKCFPRTARGKMLHWRSTGVTWVNKVVR